MFRVLVFLTGAFLFILSIGCSTANSRSLNHRVAELETRIHRLEAGPEYSQKTVPRYFEDTETISPSEMAALPERKMPKIK